MSNVFSMAVDDIFNVPQFVETFTVADNREITCIAYASDTNRLYTQFGFDNGNTITITVKTSDYSPLKGQQITFRGKTYKIDDFSTDSFALTHNITLKDMSSK